ISVTAVRRHIKELESEGLLNYGREQRGNGAPTYAYSLTQDGEGLFPNQYEDTVTRLVRHLVDTEGRTAAVSVMRQQYADLQKEIGGRLADLGPVERLEAVADVMEKAGYMAEVSAGEGLLIHNCAIHAVASCLPEVCDVELDFIQDALGADVRRKTHIVSGCNACEYSVSFAGDPHASGQVGERV
ncbi:MAG: helix-turn-helix transcriptional regulator, partial [Gemmatimonadales bacterium]